MHALLVTELDVRDEQRREEMRSDWRRREREGREDKKALLVTVLDVRDEQRREDEPRRGDVVGEEKRREERCEANGGGGNGREGKGIMRCRGRSWTSGMS